MKSSVLKSAFVPSVPSYALVAVSLLTFTGCSSGDGEGFSAKAVSIDLVNPPCAEPGAVSGYIEGNGFGAKNVSITVGGIEAEVLTATGHDASFVVPEGIPPGPIEVIVTNPGGRIATINWVTCDAACTPSGPEVCDGIDNDCNELIDDAIEDLISGSDEGECQSEIQRCADGAFTVVQPPIGPSAEECDGLDNDCNGADDDGIADIVTGTDVGECQSEIQSCVDGALVVVQAGVGPSDEVCDGLDNDCNELMDDGIEDIVSGSDVGQCQAEIQQCVDGAFTVVQSGIGPSAEVCDALDNDCNGLEDDGVPTIVMGSDVGECEPQIETCVDGTFVIFQFEVGPSPESCDSLDNDCNGIVDDEPVCEPTCVPTGAEVCDGIDNDCNDLIDDGVPDIVTGSDVGECEPQVETCTDGVFVIFQFEVGPSPESCDGLDNDCDGTDDNGIADIVTGSDVGECQSEIQQCVGGVFTVVQAGVGPAAETCDGLDNDCNGADDDGIADMVTGTDVGECQVEIQSCVGGAYAVVQPGVGPSAELCGDTLDNDCNGAVDDDPTCPAACGNVEVCDNGLDDECDGAFDDADGCGLIDGPLDELAVEHLADITNNGAPVEEYLDLGDGELVALSALNLALAPAATVQEVNDVLDAFAARVDRSRAGSRWISIRLPTAPSAAALQTIAEDLEGADPIDIVSLIITPSAGSLPTGYSVPLALAARERIDHLLAARAPAAWSASELVRESAISERPIVVVWDWFGQGPPTGNYDFSGDIMPSDFGTAFGPLGLTLNSYHGYKVLGPLAATHGAASGVVGMFPATSNADSITVRVADIEKLQTGAVVGGTPQLRDWSLVTDDVVTLLEQLTQGDQLVILLTSHWYNRCDPSLGGNTSVCDLPDYLAYPFRTDRIDWATQWIEEMTRTRSGGPLKDKVVHIAISGNLPIPADELSQFGAAALKTGLPGTVNGNATTLAPLKNIRIVESSDITTSEPITYTGRTSSSGTGGDVSANGTQVFTYTTDLGTTGPEDGTSFAAPQVAGLAAYLGSLNTDLKQNDIFSILRDTAKTGADALDAYDAVLALDTVLAGKPSGDVMNAAIRRAILDLTEDDPPNFDLSDLAAWAGYAQGCRSAPSTVYDYSRLDLNGDGQTFGAGRATFDLDLTSATDYWPTYEGTSYPLDESGTPYFGLREVRQSNVGGLTDTDILCFYAYSDLYDVDSDPDGVSETGEPVSACERRKLLNGLCHDAGNCMEPATQNLAPQSAQALAVIQVPLPDGICEDPGRIVFQSSRAGNNEIYVMSATPRATAERLTDNPASDITPAWLPRRTELRGMPPEEVEIPGGTTIGFSSNRDGVRDIYTMDAIVTDPEVPPENLTTSSVSDLSWPAWSPSDAPNGAMITFDLVNGLGRDIYVMNADGSLFPDGEERKNLTNSASTTNTISSWSPDGTQIAFATARDGDFEIYVMDLVVDASGFPQGVNVQNLTNNAALDSEPSWSPDGTRIAFMSDRGANRDIYVMNANGSGQARLTDDPARDTSPTWSPDGTQIAFRSQRDGDSEIFVIDFVTDPDGSNPRGENPVNLTENTVSDTNPRWSPSP